MHPALLLAVTVASTESRASAATCLPAVFLVSSAVVVGSAAVDIATAPASARRYNRRRVTLAPVVDRRQGRYGVALSWSYRRAPVPLPSRVFPEMNFQASRAPKSPGTALLLSLVSTGGPMLLGVALENNAQFWVFMSGLVFGPSVGQLYAGQVGRGLGTIALRGLGSAAGIASIVGCFD